MTLLDRIRRASFWPMLRKEFIEMRRDRFTLAMLIGIPAIQLVLFGYAVQTDVRNARNGLKVSAVSAPMAVCRAILVMREATFRSSPWPSAFRAP